jgi:hypothetical protein
MSSNVDRFKADLEGLISQGNKLLMAIQHECYPKETEEQLRTVFKEKTKKYIEDLPQFNSSYQRWYSESLALIRQILPDRLQDFIRLYEKPKGRKDVGYENYRIEDYFQGLTITRGVYKEKVVGTEAAIPHFRQQQAIIAAAKARFESSLFDIRNILQADLMDSELDAADHLAKSKYHRAAGAVAGVVLERHLGQVCLDRKIIISKKNPTISDFNEALKSNGVIDVPQWRYIQHLGDIRNLCDHAKKPEPTEEQVNDLLSGTRKTIKTIF